jgi:hypothetical protein
MDDEAKINSEDDMDGDKSEEEASKAITAIEEEEALIEVFINDSSQLGYSPDAFNCLNSMSKIEATHTLWAFDI